MHMEECSAQNPGVLHLDSPSFHVLGKERFFIYLFLFIFLSFLNLTPSFHVLGKESFFIYLFLFIFISFLNLSLVNSRFFTTVLLSAASEHFGDVLGAGVDRTGLIPAAVPCTVLSLLPFSEAEGFEDFFFCLRNIPIPRKTNHKKYKNILEINCEICKTKTKNKLHLISPLPAFMKSFGRS